MRRTTSISTIHLQRPPRMKSPSMGQMNKITGRLLLGLLELKNMHPRLGITRFLPQNLLHLLFSKDRIQNTQDGRSRGHGHGQDRAFDRALTLLDVLLGLPVLLPKFCIATCTTPGLLRALRHPLNRIHPLIRYSIWTLPNGVRGMTFTIANNTPAAATVFRGTGNLTTTFRPQPSQMLALERIAVIGQRIGMKLSQCRVVPLQSGGMMKATAMQATTTPIVDHGAQVSLSMLIWIQSVFGVNCRITVVVDHKVCRHMYTIGLSLWIILSG